MGRVGRPEVMDELPDALHRSIDEWILSHARHSAARIYRQFNLVEREIKADTFRRYVARVRDRAAADPSSDFASHSSPRARLLDKALAMAEERLDAGDPKHLPGIMSVVRAANDMMRVEIEEAGMERAEELHNHKLAEWERQKVEADSKLDRMAMEKGIPDGVRDQIKALYGLPLEDEVSK